MQAQPTIKPSPLKDLCGLLLFCVVGGFFALPTLSFEGAIAGRYKLALLILAFIRLAWGAYRRTIRFKDYIVYLTLVIVFCISADFCASLR
jgi:hypothetical protein